MATVLFFTRGRGRGHAVPDAEIVRHLREIAPGIDVRFASYGTGAETLRAFGETVIDLQLPEANGTAETTVAVGKLLAEIRPELVVSHEEFAALPAAKIFGLPTAAITDWFTDASMFSMQSLRYADRILFPDWAGLYPEPPSVSGRVVYTGPIVRPLPNCTKAEARAALGLSKDITLIAVCPGSWTETQAPILHLVPTENPTIWVAGSDYDLISSHFQHHNQVCVTSFTKDIQQIMRAADVAITKGTRGIFTELEALGIPSIALSHGLNPIDDQRVRRGRCTMWIDARTATTVEVAAAIDQGLSAPSGVRDDSLAQGALRAAEVLVATLASSRSNA